MIELLALVIAIILVAIFWDVFKVVLGWAFVAAAVVAVLGVAFYQYDGAKARAEMRAAQAEEQARQAQPRAQPRAPLFVLYRDDRRMADGRIEQVAVFPSREGCEIAGRALSASAARVERHFCEEAKR
jgi:hypothetical protein